MQMPNGLLPPITLMAGQRWKPTFMEHVIASPSREIKSIDRDENGVEIVSFHRLGREPRRIHKLNIHDFAAWVVYFRAYQSETTL